MFTNTQLQKILMSAKALDKKEFEKHAQKVSESNLDLAEYLISKKIVTEEQLFQLAADYFKVPFVNLSEQKIRKDVLYLIPETIAQAHKIVAFDKNDEELKVAVLDPQDLETFEFLRKKTDLKIKIFIATPHAISEALKIYRHGLKAEFGQMEKVIQPKESKEAGKELKELAEDLPVIRVVDTLLEYAIIEGASDIHIEPSEKEINVRYRIDGILKNVMILPKTIHAGIVARIKILSNLKLDEHRLPQDGRFKIATPDYKVSFRVSIIPTFDGEKVVMRLLNEKFQLLTLERLGLQPRALEIIKRNIKKPHGMILVTGPTGCGKTTTLYTILNILNTSKVNISTIEDPIEYRLPRVNQSQINPRIGYTFSTGLRALLRQDPDIIMVGEIRDKETAEIAVHAAMTGHLVLSTLHTNDAVTTLPRLHDMGIPSFLIAATTNIIIAQRLVRKICKKCIQSYNLTKEDIKELEDQLDLKSIITVLEREGAITPQKQGLQSLLFYRGKGCKECNFSGYKGRIGIYEILEITPEISELISKRVTTNQLAAATEKQNMLTILEDGFIKAKTGITTIEEVLRVSKE